MIRLPRSEVVRATRERFSTEEAEATYTRPRPGITPGGLAFVGSWAMSQAIHSAGHLEIQNERTVVVIHS